MSYVLNQISDTSLNAIIDEVNKMNKLVQGEAVKIKDEDKKGVRSMAEGREGYVRLVASAATQHERFLSRADNAADLNKLLTYYQHLGSVRQALMELFEYIDGTQWGAGADCMKLADRFNNILQTQRDNSAIDASLNEIDDWNKRYANNAPPPLNDSPTK